MSSAIFISSPSNVKISGLVVMNSSRLHVEMQAHFQRFMVFDLGEQQIVFAFSLYSRIISIVKIVDEFSSDFHVLMFLVI